jgi:hypothetical protein
LEFESNLLNFFHRFFLKYYSNFTGVMYESPLQMIFVLLQLN